LNYLDSTGNPESLRDYLLGSNFNGARIKLKTFSAIGRIVQRVLIVCEIPNSVANWFTSFGIFSEILVGPDQGLEFTFPKSRTDLLDLILMVILIRKSCLWNECNVFGGMPIKNSHCMRTMRIIIADLIPNPHCPSPKKMSSSAN
jgi:hypothetical protein